MPIEADEYDTTSPLSCPIGQKEAKRKIKGKGVASLNPNLDLFGIESAMKENNIKYDKLIELNEAQERRMEYEILVNNTLACLRSNAKTTKSIVTVLGRNEDFE